MPEVLRFLWARRELGTNGVVPAEALLLHAPVPPLVARVHAWRARDGQEHDQGMFDVARIGDLTGDAGDVVVPDERHRHERLDERVVATQRVVEFVEVAVVEAAPDGLPQLVLGDRVERGGLHDRRVVAVNHLADEPGVGNSTRAPGGARGPRTGPEPRMRRPAASRRRRGAASATSRRRVVDDVRVVVVQRDQTVVTLEGLEPSVLAAHCGTTCRWSARPLASASR